MLSTKYLFEISDLNKSRLSVAGRAALVGGAGVGMYNMLKGNDENNSSDSTNIKNNNPWWSRNVDSSTTPKNPNPRGNLTINPRGNRTALGQKSDLSYVPNRIKDKFHGIGAKIERHLVPIKNQVKNKAQKLYGGNSKYD
jgi:hypothetical protein